MIIRYAPPHGTAPGLAPFAEVLASPDFRQRLDEALCAAIKNGVAIRPAPLTRTGRLSGVGSR